MNYTQRQARATKLLTKYAQGALIYTAQGATTGDAWNPTIAAGKAYTVYGVVKGVSKEFVDGTYVVSTDLQATINAFDVVPNLSGTFSIDGKAHQIKKIHQMPAAGTPIAWRLIVGA